MEKNITMKIESNTEGHKTLTLPMSSAIERIETETKNNGKWLYCDGRITNVDCITNSDREKFGEFLANAKDITLVSALKGGM